MAGGFKFRLETVLKVRRRAYQESQRVVAERLRHIAEEHRRLNSFQNQLTQETNAVSQSLSVAMIDVNDVRRRRGYLIHLKSSIDTTRQCIARHEQELAGERKLMVTARTQLRVIEKLKERRLARYQEQLDKRETQELNEIGMQVFRRAGGAGAVAMAEAPKVQ